MRWSVGGTNAGSVKLYSDEACTSEVGTEATSALTVYAKDSISRTVTFKVVNGSWDDGKKD